MSAFASTVDPGTPVPGGVTHDGPRLPMVSVHVLGVGNTTARCSCGWAGRRRWLKAAAEQDAWAHSVQGGCVVAFPLVLTW